MNYGKITLFNGRRENGKEVTRVFAHRKEADRKRLLRLIERIHDGKETYTWYNFHTE